MATIYLGVNPDFSASGIKFQGSLDSTLGTTEGSALTCPGAFPVNIKIKFKVKGEGTLVNDSVFASSNSVVLRAIVHDDIPYSGNRIRLEVKQPTYNIAGGRHVATYETVNPIGPYLPEQTLGIKSISLAGLPAELYFTTSPTSITNTTSGTPPSDVNNVHQSSSSFQHTFTYQNMADGVNMLWNYGTSTPRMSINLSGNSTNIYFRNSSSSSDLRGAGPVQVKKYPVIPSSNTVVDISASQRTDAQYHTNSTLMGETDLDNSLLLCLSTAPNSVGAFDLNQSVFGSGVSSANYIKKLAFYKSESSAAGVYTFAAIQESSSYVGIGMFSALNQSSPRAKFLDVHYYRGTSFASTNSSIEGAGIKPAFGINYSFLSNNSETQNNQWWSDIFPETTARNQYSDVVSTQYGFVFLNKNTKHLEYMFKPHYDPGYISSAAQVINKLIHPPPRSADYIPAANMALGADLANGYSADSIYKTTAGVAAFSADHIIHGGGGHVMALGTFNGAIVSGGKIAVWGSNRWGQCIVPPSVIGLSAAIIDVAVSNSPPALAGIGTNDTSLGEETFHTHSVYSDELAEFLARDFAAFNSYLNHDSKFYNFKTYYMAYHYPPIYNEAANNVRYAGHINFKNLPGHVLIVTATGWVYAWGNDTYNQCSVPAEINLIDSTGNVRTGQNLDPIMEVSAGAFHSLARSKSGVLYAWGAGNHTVTSALSGVTYPGYLVHSSTPYPSSEAPANVRQSVHFAQCVIQGTVVNGSTYYGFANPVQNPPGTLNAAVNSYAVFTPYSSSSVSSVSDRAGNVVGQKTAANFCANEQDEAGIRCKGYIAAGAFHTAVVDRFFHIQCIGAGRGPSYNSANNDPEVNIDTIFQAHEYSTAVDTSTRPHWGCSYSLGTSDGSNAMDPVLGGLDGSPFIYVGLFGSYPHYCQSMSQYRAPYHTASPHTPAYSAPHLFRFATDINANSKSRYFQDLRFKKVVCGPFSTHGIVYDVYRGTSANIYTSNDRVELHGRVVSWGSVYGTRGAVRFATGPTGICQLMPRSDAVGEWSRSSNSPTNTTGVAGVQQYNPAGTICGMGAASFIRNLYNGSSNDFNPDNDNYVPRAFELLNRSVSDPPWTYENSTSLLSNVGSSFQSGSPVTISKFKVKDMASCGDYSIYAGYVDTLSQSSVKLYPGQAANGTTATYNNSGATFDHQSSVFFTGSDYYYSGTSAEDNSLAGFFSQGQLSASVLSLYGRMQANNPFSSGGRLVRSNKVGNSSSSSAAYIHSNATGIKINTKSLYFGEIKQSSGIANPTINTTPVSISYVNATTVLASNNMVCAVVGMDNRPTAWSCYFQSRRSYVDSTIYRYYSSALDLTLIPSIPFKEIKAGKAHILAVSDGDWPIAKSLSNLVTSGSPALQAQVPKLVTELGTRLFTSGSLTEIPTKLIAAAAAGTADHQFSRPVLLAFGAGDGREYGTSLLGYPYGHRGVATYGSWFLDTHAISRYDALASSPTQSLSVNTDDWENYYGHYRWNAHSVIDSSYALPNFVQAITNGFTLGTATTSEDGGFNQTSSLEMNLPAGHHLCESMQSMLQFQPDQYPTSFTNPILTGRTLLNGTMMAGIPVGVYRPWVSFSSLQSGQGLNRTVCCATAAEEAQSNYASLNTQLEYHSPLNFARQSYTDYVVDYAAGSLHSAILFSSACPNYNVIQDNTHLNNLADFRLHFMSRPNGEIHFGQRRICKLGIVGYGCENQTAGKERKLSDGMAPIVPMLFSRSAKVYCGESYTLVTDPVRVVYAESTATPLTFVAGTTVSTCTVPITIPAARFSKRLRGLDVTLTFNHASTGVDVPLSDLTFKLPYRRSTFVLLDRVRAGTNPAYLKVNAGASVSLKISDRFSPSKAYSYSDNPSDTYSEAGLNPANPSSYTQSTANFYINGLNLAATIPALSKQGCYYPVSVNPTSFAVTEPPWDLAPITVPKFDQTTVNIVIEDITNTNHSYTGYTVTATIEAEVDAGDVPYVLFGPDRSGVWNEFSGLGPSYVADIGSFSTASTIPTTSCPCEAQTTIITNRKFAKSFISDPNFICGTKKYGPLGNRETQAAYVAESYPPSPANPVRQPLLKLPRITANFFSIFNIIPHRPTELLQDRVKDIGVTMHSLPPGAFISTAQDIDLGNSNIAFRFNTTNSLDTFLIVIGFNPSNIPTKLVVPTVTLYNKAFFPPNIVGRLNVSSILNTIIGMRSDCP